MMENEELIKESVPKEYPQPIFNIGDKVRMKKEVLDKFDLEGTWMWHNSLRDKVLTITAFECGIAGWIDYWVEESPFILAEKWLEAVE